MDSKEFPTLEDVHVILSDLTNLFEDRNAMLHTMMKEDKYKDFLLAENIQYQWWRQIIEMILEKVE